MGNPKRLDLVSKITQCLAIGLALLAVFLPYLGVAVAVFSAISFWASSKSGRLKDDDARQQRSANLVADGIARREIDTLRKQNDELWKSLQGMRSAQSKVEDFRRRIVGNLITS
jgi:hypothetical protein